MEALIRRRNIPTNGLHVVETGHVVAVKQMIYQWSGPAQGPIELLSFAALRARNDGGTQRADFCVLGFVESGAGMLSADFAEYALEPGSIVALAPGVVHRWQDIDAVEGSVVVFLPTAPVTTAAQAASTELGRRIVWQPSEADRPFIDMARAHLVLESGAAQSAVAEESTRLALTLLLTRLDPMTDDSATGQPLFRSFRVAVERDFRSHHDAAHYASTLGYSSRTLTRAVQRATGVTPKAFISERLVLEAKRLLAHDGLTAAACAVRLGFLDPSNFSTMFRTKTGQTPGAWQRQFAPLRSSEARATSR